jgi:hypothetical protein
MLLFFENYYNITSLGIRDLISFTMFCVSLAVRGALVDFDINSLFLLLDLFTLAVLALLSGIDGLPLSVTVIAPSSLL